MFCSAQTPLHSARTVALPMKTAVNALHRSATWAMPWLSVLSLLMSLLLACGCATPTAPESRYTVDLPA